jgi:hypothetical protein
LHTVAISDLRQGPICVRELDWGAPTVAEPTTAPEEVEALFHLVVVKVVMVELVVEVEERVVIMVTEEMVDLEWL